MENIHIGWPEGILLVFCFMAFCVHLAKHGEPRGVRFNAGTCLLDIGLTLGLLYWGGFFS